MNSSKIKFSKNDSSRPSRDPYKPPGLTVFGPVRALTQGGTGPNPEGMGGMAPMMQMV